MQPSAATDEDAAGKSRGGLRTVLLGALLVVALLSAVVLAAARGRPDATPPAAAPLTEPGTTLADRPPPGERFPLPDRTLPGFGDGPDVVLSELRGQPLVVNFWATWCAPCVQEMPVFAETAAELEGRVTFLGVDVQDAPANAEPFVDTLEIGYPLALDPDAELYREVRAFGMPTTLLVRPDGTVVYRHTGALEAEQLRALLAEHLGVRS